MSLGVAKVQDKVYNGLRDIKYCGIIEPYGLHGFVGLLIMIYCAVCLFPFSCSFEGGMYYYYVPCLQILCCISLYIDVTIMAVCTILEDYF